MCDVDVLRGEPRERLDFLSLLLSDSSLLLAQTQVEDLWDTFLVDTDSAGEREAMLHWFAAALPGRSTDSPITRTTPSLLLLHHDHYLITRTSASLLRI